MPASAWLRRTGLLVVVALVLTVGGTTGATAGRPEGVVEVVINKPFDAVDSSLKAAIKATGFLVLAELNYQLMQKMVGRNIPGAKSYMYFRPDLGTPVFEKDRNAALEIPLKIVILDLGGGKTAVRYRKMETSLSPYSGLGDLGRRLDGLTASVVQAVGK